MFGYIAPGVESITDKVFILKWNKDTWQSWINFDTQLEVSLTNYNFLDLESLSDFDHDNGNREID